VMTRRTLLLSHVFLFFILFMGNAGVGTIAPTSSSPPTISLTPALSVVPRFGSLVLNLSIFNITDLCLWVTTIQWNSTVLNLTSYSEGPFLKQRGQTTFIVGRVTPGLVEELTCCLLGNVSGVSGSGTLAALQFNATEAGWTSINIIFSDLLNSAGESIPHDKINSTVTVTVPNHDVSVISVKPLKAVVGQGWAISINATVQDIGDYAESFNVTAYANATIIGSENITLPAGDSTTVTLSWNTTGSAKGNHTTSAYAWPVPGETDTADNNFTGGWVIVSMAGDLTGGTPNPWNFVPDGKVDGKDIAIVALCFGSAPGCQSPWIWNPNSDVNNDAKVDGKDIALVALHFGEASFP